MIIVRVLFVALFSLADILPQAALAGGITSSGGEVIYDEENPWYIGARSVRYCIRHSEETFSASLVEVRLAIQYALNDWVATITLLKPKTARLRSGKELSFTTEYSEVPCSESPELTFHLGTFTHEIEAILDHRALHTVAFAGKTGFDPTTGRARGGVVWLAPDLGPRRYRLGAPRMWSSPEWPANALKNVLLHELGHVFGFQHSNGFMSAEFPGKAVWISQSLQTSLDFLRLLDDRKCGRGMIPTEFSDIIPWGAKLCVTYPSTASTSNAATRSGASPAVPFQVKFEMSTPNSAISTLTATMISGAFSSSVVVQGKYPLADAKYSPAYESHLFIDHRRLVEAWGYLETSAGKIPVHLSARPGGTTLRIFRGETVGTIAIMYL